MATATLSEQMGAMALVDQLRQQQMVLKEHLDLPERRDEVARRIREYYRSKNIDFDDALVAQGVRAYFDRRLSFDAPHLGKVAALCANLYVERSRWLKPAAVALGAAVAIGAGGWLATEAYHSAVTRQMQTRLQDTSGMQASLKDDIQAQLKKLDALRKRQEQASLPAASNELAVTSQLLARASEIAAVSLPMKVDSGSPEVATTILDRTGESLKTARALVHSATDKLDGLVRIFNANDTLAEVTRGGEYARARDAHPILSEAERAARRELEQFDLQAIDAVERPVGKLARLLADVPAADAVASDVHAVQAKLRAMRLSKEESEEVDIQVATALAAAKAIDMQGARRAAADLEATERFAETPATLRIVDRAGVRSGVERRYKPSGGKSWFLIVQAEDPSGNILTIPVLSAETGERKKTERFGVRVSQDEYQRAKESKQRTGHIDDRELARKAANSLSFVFSHGVSSKPDMILEW